MNENSCECVSWHFDVQGKLSGVKSKIKGRVACEIVKKVVGKKFTVRPHKKAGDYHLIW